MSLWTRDEGISGSNGLDTRSGLLDALGAIKDGDAQGLVVYRLDRLARDLIIQETLLGELRRLGSSVFSTSASESAYLGDDPDDPSRRLIRQVLGAVSEYERSMIALRLRSGRRRKADKGGYAYGAPPYGWKAEDGALVPVPDEQQIVARIIEMRDEGLSLRAISSALEAEGVSSRRAARFSPQALSDILRRAAT